MYQTYNKVVIAATGETVGTGWLPPMPDLRDYTDAHPKIVEAKEALKIQAAPKTIPPLVDLRACCSQIENQGNLGSCSAHAGMGIVEYYERKAFGKYVDGSRLFLYKTTRNLMQVTGDTGAWLRNVMAALVRFGVPEEKYWPYSDSAQVNPLTQVPTFDTEPPAFVYAVAKDFRTVSYFRHDPIGSTPDAALNSVKTWIAAGVPAMFGFYGFPSFGNTDVPGGIPYPAPAENAVWGHAICAVGYDDNKKITNTKSGSATVGALVIRNSWGTAWGQSGYGYLPYDYVTHKLALDFWSIVSMNWFDAGNFGM